MIGELVAGDVEYAVHAWAKANPRISAVFSGQIHFEVPGKTPPFPLLTIESAGGGAPLILSEALIEETIVSFSCWAKAFDKATSARCAAVVKTEAFNLYRAPFTVTLDGRRTTLQSAGVSNAIWAPDPKANLARHVVSATFSTTTTAVA